MVVEIATTSPTSLVLQSSHLNPPGWRYLPAVDLYIVDSAGEGLLKTLEEEGAVLDKMRESNIQIEASPNDPPDPNDPMLNLQKGILREGQYVGLSEAWAEASKILIENSPVTVAIIDTGIDLTHPDLQDNIWRNKGEIEGNGIDDDGNGYVDDVHGYNFIENNNDVRDDNNHGTHLAGIIGAIGNNGIGIAGINWHVRLMPLKFANSRGKGSSILAIEAIDYAIRNGANIINASWTIRSGEDTSDEDRLLAKAIQKAGEAGVLFVTASGNQFETHAGLNIDETPVYPASFQKENVITVAALSAKGDLADFSNYGRTTVDLAAPGSDILSTISSGRYGVMSGTSMAAAFVSGSASLLACLNPELNPAQIKSILKESAATRRSLQDVVSSQGILNIQTAVSQVLQADISGSTTRQTPSQIHNTPVTGGCSLITP